jgi:lipoyl(octanoyl) transferase
MSKKVWLHQLGLLDYKSAWNLQETLFKSIVDRKIQNRREEKAVATENHLLLVEHPPVYTLGKNGDLNNLLVSEKVLSERGAEFYKINRGGDITFHGPGQLVGYPILDLDHFFTDIHKYLRLLEESVIATLAYYGIKSERSAGETGVWLEAGTPMARKICAMGIRASRWVTMHGIALNVNTDLGYFDLMIPCGIKGKSVTSMKAELGAKCPSLKEVQFIWTQKFAEIFEATLVDTPTLSDRP